MKYIYILGFAIPQILLVIYTIYGTYLYFNHSFGVLFFNPIIGLIGIFAVEYAHRTSVRYEHLISSMNTIVEHINKKD